MKNIRKDIQRFQVGRGDELLENREIELDKELLDFKLITHEDLKEIFKIMKKKNYHHDPIPIKILTDCFPVLSTYILQIVNDSLQTGSFPSCLTLSVPAV